MIHRIKEGSCMRWGLNVGRGYIGVKLHRRLIFWVDPRVQNSVSWYVDLTQDHRMYRPNDVDQQAYFYCRRCQKSVYEAPEVCSGKVYYRRRW